MGRSDRPSLVRLRAALRVQSRELTATPAGGRLGAALALISQRDGSGFAIVYTRRRDDLPHHPGQISFPGGRAEPGEDLESAALREAAEEIALDPSTVTLLGRLPAFYIPPSRFWLQTVVAHWARPHPLTAAPGEVAEVLHVPYTALADRRRWRSVRSAAAQGAFWAWQLDGGHLLWGATAVATAGLLDLLAPGWSGGQDVADLGADREIRPWEDEPYRVPRPGPARLTGVPERALSDPGVRDRADGAPDLRLGVQTVAAAAAGVAAATVELAGGRGRVLMLAGHGGTGAVGMATAALLRRDGAAVHVVVPAPMARPGPLSAAWAAELDAAISAFSGVLPPADVVVDGLVGAGLAGPLRNGVRAVAHALRTHTAPVLSIDLPSGLHPLHGLIGEALSADVTVAVGPPRPGLFAPGLAPFVGDLYTADLVDGSLVRLVAASRTALDTT